MGSICNIPEEKLPFQILGLCLQEPNEFITDTLVTLVCILIYSKLVHSQFKFFRYWKYFFLLFGISTFLGGLGHLFFYYTGMYGKFPSWILAFVSAFYAGRAMLSLTLLPDNIVKVGSKILYVKMFLFIGLALYFQSFMLVTVDASITYLVYCLGLGSFYKKKGFISFKYIIIGVLILIPTALVFLLNINPSIYFNKNDLSHILMILTLILFYLGVLRFDKKNVSFLTSKNS